MSDWNILVVEDDPDSQEVVSRILRHHNITIEVTGTAEDALKILGQRKFTLAIIDLALPQADGWQLLQSIRETPAIAKLPCVAVTAFHSAEVAVKAIKSGFNAYFSKPLDATSFVRELQNLAARFI